MNTITAKEAKIRFGQLLTAVQREPVTITKNGNPVAVMMPIANAELASAIEEVIENHYWGVKAQRADDEGYLDPKASEDFLNECLGSKT